MLKTDGQLLMRFGRVEGGGCAGILIDTEPIFLCSLNSALFRLYLDLAGHNQLNTSVNLENHTVAKFLKTTGVSHYLEQLIDNANERLILVSPYLKINARIKSKLEDKDRLKIDIRLIFEKSELQSRSPDSRIPGTSDKIQRNPGLQESGLRDWVRNSLVRTPHNVHHVHQVHQVHQSNAT